RAQTLHGAQLLHLEDRVGSLEPGKDADFVVLSGPPYSIYTQVLQTYIDGVRVFDRSRQKDWAYQAGGFALADLDRLPKPPAALQPLPKVVAPDSPPNATERSVASNRLAIFAGRIHTVAQGVITDGAI